MAEKYLAEKDRYKIVMENTTETFPVRAQRLTWRDRTPLDCGYYLTLLSVNVFFASDEELQAFQAVASPTEIERAAKAAVAAARGDEAAAALLVNLDGEKTVHIAGQEETQYEKGKE